MEYRVSIIIALVVLLVVIFIWKRSEGAKGSKGSKGFKGSKGSKGKGKSTNKGGAKKPVKRNQESMNDAVEDVDESDESDEKPVKKGDIAEDAKELYDLVHNELAAGMQIDAFEEAAGDLAGDEPSEVFVALKQKYTEAIDANRDPTRSVSVKDYVEILKKSG
jgi:hypothetical protein